MVIKEAVKPHFTNKGEPESFYGLFANEKILKDQMIGIYTGSLFTACTRAQKDRDFFYHFQSDLSRLPKDTLSFVSLNLPACTDALEIGNETRFINHSCMPNTKPRQFRTFLAD